MNMDVDTYALGKSLRSSLDKSPEDIKEVFGYDPEKSYYWHDLKDVVRDRKGKYEDVPAAEKAAFLMFLLDRIYDTTNGSRFHIERSARRAQDFRWHREGGGRYEAPYNVFSGSKKDKREVEEAVYRTGVLKGLAETLEGLFHEVQKQEADLDVREEWSKMIDLMYDLQRLPASTSHPEDNDSKRDVERSYDNGEYGELEDGFYGFYRDFYRACPQEL